MTIAEFEAITLDRTINDAEWMTIRNTFSDEQLATAQHEMRPERVWARSLPPLSHTINVWNSGQRLLTIDRMMGSPPPDFTAHDIATLAYRQAISGLPFLSHSVGMMIPPDRIEFIPRTLPRPEGVTNVRVS